nr:MFS transporter [Sphingobium sp. EM0848]
MAAFITLLTEIMPAGLLSSISTGLHISESMAGQFITAFALGALLSAIPVTAMTRSVRRKPLLLTAIMGFAIVNFITAISSNVTLSLFARFVAGLFGGVVWSMLAGYAVRMAPKSMSGRAIAIAGGGATAALVFGVPLGAAFSKAVGWQGAFAIVSATAALLVGWIMFAVPDYPGDAHGKQESFLGVLSRPGIAATVMVIFVYIAGHNIIYIYIEPFLHSLGRVSQLDFVLLLFGIGSIGGLALVGTLIDRHLLLLGPLWIAFFLLADLIWISGPSANLPMYGAAIFWGISFGGFGVITQAATARLAENAVDIAQSACTTAWNTAVACGGISGGVLLNGVGPSSFPIATLALLIVAVSILILRMNRVLAVTG